MPYCTLRHGPVSRAPQLGVSLPIVLTNTPSISSVIRLAHGGKFGCSTFGAASVLLIWPPEPPVADPSNPATKDPPVAPSIMPFRSPPAPADPLPTPSLGVALQPVAVTSTAKTTALPFIPICCLPARSCGSYAARARLPAYFTLTDVSSGINGACFAPHAYTFGLFFAGLAPPDLEGHAATGERR